MAREFHPDKTTDKEEEMKLLNEAYAVLSNPEAREKFDRERDVFDDGLDDVAAADSVEIETLMTTSEPFSAKFRRQHTENSLSFSRSTTYEESFAGFHARLKFNPYPDEILNLFHYIQTMQASADSEKKAVTVSFDDSVELTLEGAINLFLEFLSGGYYGENLKLSIEYFKAQPESPHKSLCNAFCQIESLYLEAKNDPQVLLKAIETINTFAAQITEMPYAFSLLFQDYYYRYFVQDTLLSYWKDTCVTIDERYLSLLDGQEATKAYLTELRERIASTSEYDDSRSQQVEYARYVKLLMRYEQDTKKPDLLRTPQDYREKAYQILDWTPIFSGIFGPDAIAQLFIQAGLYFQLSSIGEPRPQIKAADESLAKTLYIIAYTIARRSTIDIELKTITLIVHYLSRFSFIDGALKELVKGLEERALFIINMFPFVVSPTPIVSCLTEKNRLLHLMRSHLKELMEEVVFNEGNIIQVETDQSPLDVLYQAYEACLKGWYDKPVAPETESTIRLLLIVHLLESKGYSIADIEAQVAFSTLTIHRDEEGWIQPVSMLEESPEPNNTLCGFDGIEINHETSKVTFIVLRSNSKTPDCFRVLAAEDLLELMRLNIGSAIFSLDPEDSNYPFHPFNKMRFAPPSVKGSRLLKTLLAADYLLKFFTVGQEVRGKYPFDSRSLITLMSHLPAFLKQVITDFHAAQHTEAAHRFWIEAVSIPVSLDEDKLMGLGVQHLKVDIEPEVIVRKHKLMRNADGELIDDPNDHEGWFFYLLDDATKRRFDLGEPISNIKTPSIFLYPYSNRIRFLDNNERSNCVLQDYDDQLLQFFDACKADETGLIVETPSLSQKSYRLIKKIESQTGKPTHFSPEYIFAQEFTKYYNEFALYFPVFKRLKELCRCMTLVRLLKSTLMSTERLLENLNQTLQQINRIQSLAMINEETLAAEDVFLRMYRDISSQVKANLAKNISNIKQQVSEASILSEHKSRFESIRAEYYQLCSQYPDADVRSHIEAQLFNSLSGQLSSEMGSGGLKSAISTLLSGNAMPLAKALTAINMRKVISDVAAGLEVSGLQAKQLMAGNQATLNAVTQQKSQPIFLSHLIKERDQLTKLIRCKMAVVQKLKAYGLNSEHTEDETDTSRSDACLWVPAAVMHHVTPTGSSNKLVYGGVSLQARLIMARHVAGNAQAIRGNLAPNRGAGARAGAGGGSGGGAGGGAGGGSASGSSGRFNRQHITKGFQDHHIVSDKNQFTKNHKLIRLAGANLQSRQNRIFLPKHAASHPTRSIHLGRHYQSYSHELSIKMTDAVKQGKQNNWTQQQYHQAYSRIVGNFRANLKAGNIALNKHARPWASPSHK